MASVTGKTISQTVIDPFVYKIYPEDYLAFSKAAIDRPHLFREIREFRQKILAAQSEREAFRLGYSSIRGYQELLTSRRDLEWRESGFREEALAFLEELEHYHYFFKETGAGLKFNPLSGKSSGKELRARMRDLLGEYLSLIEPRALYAFVDSLLDERGIRVKGTDIRFDSPQLTAFFSAPYGGHYTMHSMNVPVAAERPVGKTTVQRAMILYLVTIGSGIDDTVRSFMRDGRVFDAYLLNGIGGGAAEMVAFDLTLYVNDSFVEDGLRAKYQRFSPGYGDWPVSDQQKIFRLLEPEKTIAVHLTEGNVMIPEKSTSGIMGLKMMPAE